MSLYRPVNLPAPVLLTSLTEVGLGLYLAIFRRAPYSSATSEEGPVPPTHARRTADIISVLGVASCGLGLMYLFSSYMPVDKNQFLHATVPVRLILSGLMTTNLLIHGREGMSKEGFWGHVALAAIDGITGVLLGNWLGRYDGLVAGVEHRIENRETVEGVLLL